MHASIPDAQLLDRWRTRRDADAFTELVSRYGPLVYSACLRVLRCRTAAEDAAQDCFVELFQSRARVRSLPCYLHVTATHRALDRLKAEKRRGEREARFAAAQPETVQPDWDDLSAMVDEAIAHLPEKLRLPVVLRFLQGQSYAEIASETGLPVSTVQYRLNRGIEGIRGHLAKRGLAVGASSLAALLAAAPSDALPGTAAAKLGTLALAGGGAPIALATASTWGGLFGVKSVLTALALLAIAAMPVVFVSTRGESPKAMQTSNAVFADAIKSAQAIVPVVPDTVATAAPLTSQIDAAQIDAGPSVLGTVLHANGRPAQEVLVALDWNSESWTTQSDAAGKFSIPLPPGFGPVDGSENATVSLRAEKDMYRTFAENYEVSATGASGIVLKLESTGTISGQVVDTEGNPLGGWRVNAMGDGFWTNTIATDKGEFTIAGIRPGDYTIYAYDKEGRRTDYNSGKAMTLEGLMSYTGIILTWPQTDVSIAGYVTDENGIPVPGVKLSANWAQNTEAGEKPVQLVAQSDESGRYFLAGFPATEGLEVTVQLSHHAHMQAIRYGVRVDGHEENFTIFTCPSIRGRVIDAATRERVASFRVTTLIGQSQVPGFADEDAFVLSNTWDKYDSPDGAFKIQARGYGNVRVAVAAPGYVTAVKSLSDTLPGADVEDVEIALEPARPLNGIVVDEAGIPVAGAQIFFGYPMYPGRDTHFTSGWEGITQTNDAGEFTLTEFPPSLSVVSAFHDDFALGWTEAKGTSPLRITLAKGAVIEGTVSLDGAPLENNRAHINLEAGGTGIKITFGGDGGAYKMDRVPAGSFLLSAGFHEGGLRRYIRRAVVVERGKTDRQDINFDSTGSSYVEGVLQLDGQPLPESLIRATLIAANGDTLLFQTSARGDGTFLLGPIPAGDYDFGAEWFELQDGSCRSPDMETLSLQEDETVKHDLLYTSR